jgi:hypothetical protein
MDRRGSASANLPALAAGAPKVTAPQWALTVSSLALAALGFFFGSHEELTLLAWALTGLNALLLILVAREALRVRVVGKLFLVASTLLFFWIEAVEMALQNPPFPAPAGLPMIWGRFSGDLVSLAYLYVTLFQCMLFAGYSVRLRLRPLYSWVASRVDSQSELSWLGAYLLAACAFVPLLLAHRFDVWAAVQALLAARSGDAPEAQDVGLLQNLYFLGLYGAAFLLAQAFVFSGRLRIAAGVVGALAAAPFVMGGTRHLWLFIAFPLLVLSFARFRGKVNLLYMIRVGVAVGLVLLVAQLQFAFRDVGWLQTDEKPAERLSEVSTTGQFTALLFAEFLVPEEHDHFLEPAEPYFLIHWIPRAFWPDKPVMRSWTYYNDAYTQGQAFNVTPSVIGQFHMNWGIFGVLFIGVWLGLLTGLADRALLVVDVDRQRALGVAIGMFYAFIVSSFRFYSPIYFTYFVFGFAGMFVLSRRGSPRRQHGALSQAEPGAPSARAELA